MAGQQPQAFRLIGKDVPVSKRSDEEIRMNCEMGKDEKNTITSGRSPSPHNFREPISELSVKSLLRAT